MFVHTIVDGMACIYRYYPASLTISLAVMSAPFCRRSEQVSVSPLLAAMWRALHPHYNNRETERQRDRDRSNQRHTGGNTDTQIEEGSREGPERSGCGREG
jgi:hypothetical protein